MFRATHAIIVDGLFIQWAVAVAFPEKDPPVSLVFGTLGLFIGTMNYPHIKKKTISGTFGVLTTECEVYCTGFRDKNGREIYGGDILKCFCEVFEQETYHIVAWSSTRGMWFIIPDDLWSRYPNEQADCLDGFWEFGMKGNTTDMFYVVNILTHPNIVTDNEDHGGIIDYLLKQNVEKV